MKFDFSWGILGIFLTVTIDIEDSGCSWSKTLNKEEARKLLLDLEDAVTQLKEEINYKWKVEAPDA